VDCYAVSDFSKDPARALTLQDELNAAVYGMTQARTLLPDATMYFLPGNHEIRIERFKRRVVELAGLDNMRISSLLHFDELGIKAVTHGKPFKLGGLWHIHGDEVQGGSVNTARNVYSKYQGNVIFGHYHRMQVHYNRLVDGTCHGAWANGCLCDLEQEYVLGISQWQRGFSLIDHFEGGLFHVEQIVYFEAQGHLMAIYKEKLYVE